MTHPSPPLRRAVFALAVFTILGGCAAQTSTRYPSLLPRAIESRSDAEPETPIAIADPDPSADAALAELRKTLDKTVADFTPAAGTAERLAAAARGAAAGSERWITAQSALAELDGYRASTSAVLTEVDTMAITRATDGKPVYPAITNFHDTAQQAFDAQTAQIARISAMLPAG